MHWRTTKTQNDAYSRGQPLMVLIPWKRVQCNWALALADVCVCVCNMKCHLFFGSRWTLIFHEAKKIMLHIRLVPILPLTIRYYSTYMCRKIDLTAQMASSEPEIEEVCIHRIHSDFYRIRCLLVMVRTINICSSWPIMQWLSHIFSIDDIESLHRLVLNFQFAFWSDSDNRNTWENDVPTLTLMPTVATGAAGASTLAVTSRTTRISFSRVWRSGSFFGDTQDFQHCKHIQDLKLSDIKANLFPCTIGQNLLLKKATWVVRMWKLHVQRKKNFKL